jgi:hypothetical protein
VAGEIGVAVVPVVFDTSQVRREVNKLGNQVENDLGRKVVPAAEKSGRQMSAALQKGLRVAAVGATAALGALTLAAGKAVQGAVNLGEQVNKTRVVFGRSGEGIVKWSETTADALGISQAAALEATGTFGNMLVPMGIARDQAAGMSKRMVELAADMASFNNASPEETLQAIRSGLAGETEPLRRFGVFLNEARIQQEAFSLGLTRGADRARAAAEAVKAATASVAEAQRERAQAATAVESASRRVATAEQAVENASKSLAAAQERLRDDNERLADSEDRAAAATQRVRDAKQALRAAQEKAREVQLALVEARKRATEQLEDLREASTDAALSEERAGLSLERARERLAAVSADSESSELDRREAMLAVREAEEGLSDAQERRQDTTDELADAEKRGVAGADNVLAAQRAVVDAQRDSERAARAVTDARRKERDALDGVADATRAVATSQRNLREEQQQSRQAIAEQRTAQVQLARAQQASERAAQNLAAAEQALTAAREEQRKAGPATTKQLTAQQKAMASYSLILKDTKDAQGDFARTSDSLANRQRVLRAQYANLSASLGKALIPALEKLAGVFVDLMAFFSRHQTLAKVLAVGFAALAVSILAVNAALAVTAVVAAPVALVVLGVIAAVAALTVGIILLYKHSESFREFVGQLQTAVEKLGEAFAAVPEIVESVIDAFAEVLDWLKRHWPEIAVLISGPFAPLVLLATDAFGVRSALIGAFGAIIEGARRILGGLDDVVRGIGGAVASAASAVGDAIWNGIRTGLGNLAGNVRALISGALTFGADFVQLILGLAKAVGTAIENGVVEGVTGIGARVRNFLRGALTFGADFLGDVLNFGKAVGQKIEEGIMAGLRGLGDAIRKLLRRILGRLGRVGAAAGGLFGRLNPRSVVPQMGPLAPAPAAVGRAAPRAEAGAGGLAGPVPFGARLQRALSKIVPSAEVELGPVQVNVYIGERELEQIVRTEVVRDNVVTAQTLLAGVR